MISFLPRFIPLAKLLLPPFILLPVELVNKMNPSDVKSLSSTNLNKDSTDPSQLIGKSSSDSLNLEEFFGLEERVQTCRTIDGADITDDQNLSTKATESKAYQVRLPSMKLLLQEMALNTLEQNALKHQKAYTLRKINNFKDKTIADLSALNEELLDEIKGWNWTPPAETRVKPIYSSSEETDGKSYYNLPHLKIVGTKSAEIKDFVDEKRLA